MADLNETTILEDGPVRVTNRRTIIGTITYTMSDIKAVHITSQAKNKKPLLWTIPGILLLAWSLIDETGQFMEFFNLGIFLIAVSIVLILIAKPTYAVQIGSASGENSIL